MNAHADKPAAANSIKKRLSALMQLAILKEWRLDDPTRYVKSIKSKGTGHHSWSEQEIALHREFWPSGSKPRLALELLLDTGQRKSDVIRMGRQPLGLSGDRFFAPALFSIRQQKTGMEVTVPVLPELQAELSQLAKDHLTFLVTEAGAPFTAGGFGNWFHQAVAKAGLPAGLSAHGLRKAAARRLAERGCTTKEIMAVGGWKTEKEVRRYTEAADQTLLAKSAMAKLMRRREPASGG